MSDAADDRGADSSEPASDPRREPSPEAREGTRLIASGVGLGALGAASALVLGATCPLCVVGAPALVGWGVYKRWRASSEPPGADE